MAKKDYFSRHALYPPFIQDDPKDMDLAIVIPCYHEELIRKTIDSLHACGTDRINTEVIIVVNDGAHEAKEIVEYNDHTYAELLQWKANYRAEGLTIYPIRIKNIPPKKAGVGMARKIGMDEAARRLPENGVMVGFDADSLCCENFLKEIRKFFQNNPEIEGCSIHYEHPIMDDGFGPQIINAIIQYELHLRYFIDMQRRLKLPYAFQTIGSSMAVRNRTYQALGGMNTRKAGEDFYFLQKIIKNRLFADCVTTRVIPSPRISTRVPFGTGKAIKDMIDSGCNSYQTYNPHSFRVIERFLQKLPDIFIGEFSRIEHLDAFLGEIEYRQRINEIRSNTTDYPSFVKRFYRWFDAFLLMKALHFLRDSHYPNISVVDAINLVNNSWKSYTPREKLKSYRKLAFHQNYYELLHKVD